MEGGICDVAVIGAGPAGSHAALECAKNGLDTVVLEEHKTVGDPVHCGECLSDLCLQKFPLNLPDEAISLKVKGIRVIFPDGTASVLMEPGVVLEKHRFEQHIASLAQARGARLCNSSRVGSMKKNNGHWELETTSGTHKAKLVIDASGVVQASSRLANLGQKSETVLGAQYEMDDIPQEGFIDFYFWPRLSPHGYLWMIPKSGGRANVGLVTRDKAKIKSYLGQFVKEMGWGSKKILKSFGGLIPSSGPLPRTYSDGLLLVGDAAGFTSPLFEGGTHLSLASGAMAAKVAKTAITSGDLSGASLSEYEGAWRSEFPDYGKLIVGKNVLYKFTDQELNTIAHAIPRDLSALDPLKKAMVGGKMLLARPGLFAKNVIPALLAFGYSRAQHYGW